MGNFVTIPCYSPPTALPLAPPLLLKNWKGGRGMVPMEWDRALVSSGCGRHQTLSFFFCGVLWWILQKPPPPLHFLASLLGIIPAFPLWRQYLSGSFFIPWSTSTHFSWTVTFQQPKPDTSLGFHLAHRNKPVCPVITR